MKKLISVEQSGALQHKTWLHTGDSGQECVTIQTYQDVAPVLRKIKDTAQSRKGKDFQYLGSIPENLVNELTYELAKTWGISVRDAYSELVRSKTDRAKKVWKMLLKSREYRKLQAKNYV